MPTTCRLKTATAARWIRGLRCGSPARTPLPAKTCWSFRATAAVILDLLLKRILTLPGVRIARPGEFPSARFNDKLDLAQAEAIADLIDASSEQAARSALNSLQGAFSTRVNHLVEALTHLRIYVEAAIDFPDEEIDFSPMAKSKPS
jgi:tRNA U34 5-carboxymethylaminomethyl modifying GTPase MnmE/TrmE